MDFSCPTCHELLEAQTLDDIRLWKCATCRGFAVSLPIVRKGLNPETFRQIWQRLSSGETEAGRSCPGCRNPLRMVDADGLGGAIEIDVCRSCQILWFDDEEFSALPKPDTKKQQERELSAKETLAISAFKDDHRRSRSMLLKLLDKKIQKDFGLDHLFGDLFDG